MPVERARLAKTPLQVVEVALDRMALAVRLRLREVELPLLAAAVTTAPRLARLAPGHRRQRVVLEPGPHTTLLEPRIRLRLVAVREVVVLAAVLLVEVRGGGRMADPELGDR